LNDMNSVELTKMVRERLEAFEAGGVPLHQLVGDLRSIQDSFPTPKPAWLKEFDRLRFGLEEVNAVRLAEENVASDLHEDLVRTSVAKLKALLSTEY
jgi:hypothetical protein